jgi:hypothetical protein
MTSWPLEAMESIAGDPLAGARRGKEREEIIVE